MHALPASNGCFLTSFASRGRKEGRFDEHSNVEVEVGVFSRCFSVEGFCLL
jgi:hypothetical protein